MVVVKDSVILPTIEGVLITDIRRNVFDGPIMTKVTILDIVNYLKDAVFYWYISLTSVTFSANSQLKTVGEHILESCNSLTSIAAHFPVKVIGKKLQDAKGRLFDIMVFLRTDVGKSFKTIEQCVSIYVSFGYLNLSKSSIRIRRCLVALKLKFLQLS